MTSQSTHLNTFFLFAGLGGLIAAVLLGCAPDDLRQRESLSTRPDAAATGHDPRALSASGVESGAGAPSPRDARAGGGQGSRARARGLWILAEGSYRALDDPARIGLLIDRAERLGATDLFVQVYRGGRAFYAAGPGTERDPDIDRLAAAGVDTLAELIAEAHRRGMAVHAWVNVLSLSTRRDAQMIADLGPGAILVDRYGRSILDYPDLDLPEPDRRFYRMGTRGLYLDPAVPAVRARLLHTFGDLLARYPELDGLHLDYIRHPDVLPFSPGSRFGVGLEFGYGAESRARYRAETGRPDPIEGAPPGTVRSASAWDEWRRHQVTTLVEEISSRSHAASPELVVSAAVIAYVDRAYLSLAQDWKGWLESGALDLAIPMVYTLDDRLLRYQLETFAGWPESARIWPGLGVWLFEGAPGRATDQLAQLRANGFGGEVLFSDDALSQAPALLEALVETAPRR